jgi:hypothetical protein
MWSSPESLYSPPVFSVHSDAWMFCVTVIEMWLLWQGEDPSNVPFPKEIKSQKSPAEIALAIRDKKFHPKIPENFPISLQPLITATFVPEPKQRPSFQLFLSSLDLLLASYK